METCKIKHTHTKHMNTNKNAYEIRLEILHMAHNDAMQKYLQTISVYRENDNSKLTIKQLEESFPKTEDIKKRAKELYFFIEGF